jgi:predicted TPR repeat methyltransferase
MNDRHTDSIKCWRRALADAGFCRSNQPSFHCSQLLDPSGDRAAAESACRTLLADLPEHPGALEGLAFLLQLQGRTAEASCYRERLLRLRIRDLGVDQSHQGEATAYLLAAEGWKVQPMCAPRAYVRALFDRYASGFDAHLREKLHYRGPELFHENLRAVVDLTSVRFDVLDIGCGTGLAGEVFRGLANRLDGLDLSPAMLENAGARGTYDRLEQGEIVERLPRLARVYDLVLAADVLVYFGDLSALFNAVLGVLKGGGYFVCSVERGETKDFRLRSTGRYQHNPRYVRELAEELGFKILRCRQVTLREQDDRPVTAVVFVFGRRLEKAP